jgi:hypothetical protein
MTHERSTKEKKKTGLRNIAVGYISFVVFEEN